MSKKSVVIYSPLSGGHHEMYLNKISKEFAKEDFDVFVLSKNIELTYTDDRIHFLPFNYDYSKNSFVRWIRNRIKLSNVIKYIKTKNQTTVSVFFTWVDSERVLFSARILGLLNYILGIRSWGGIYFHPILFRNRYDSWKFRLKRYVYESFIRDFTCKACAVLDEGIVNDMSKILKSNILLFPDFTEIEIGDNKYQSIKSIEKLANNRKVILLAGFLSRRKNIIKFLDFATDPKLSQKYFFVLAGELARDTFRIDELKQIDINIEKMKNLNSGFAITERLEDERELNQLVKFSSFLFIAYDEFKHSSNFVVKGAYFKVPVLVSPGFLMEERVTKWNLGCVINLNYTAEDFDKCLRSCILKNESADKYYELNSARALEKAVHEIGKLL